jgi:aminopeptidase N
MSGGRLAGMPSLTRAEATRRAAQLAVQGYAVALDLDIGDERFASQTTVTFQALADGVQTWVDVKATDVHEVLLDGIPVDLAGWRDGRLALPALAGGAHTLSVDATMAYRRDGSGLHRAVDPADGEAYVYVQSFLDYAPAVFACFDQPDLKAPISLRVHAPAHWIIVGNGAATQVGDGEWELAATAPISTYLFTVCGGPFVSVRDSHDGIPLGLHARASMRAELERWAPQIFEVTKQSFDAYHALFGIRYPFGDYHQVFVPDFNAIAMENPGCITLRDSLLYRGTATPDEVLRRSRTVCHEMAHMWFGDLVTMRWWDDLWLNESFAEYLAHRVLTGATEFADAWVDFGILRKPWGYAAERAPSAHPVAGAPALTAEDALSDFDGISYAKGATAIRQLIAYVGDEAFIAGVSAYLRDKAFGNGTFAEFLAAIEAASGQDLGDWARAWLLTTGRDTLRVEADGVGAVLARVSPAAYPSCRPHVLDVGVYAADAPPQVTRARVEGDRTDLPELRIGGVNRIVLPNSSDLTWASVDFDEATLGALPGRLGELTDPLVRSVCWQALDDGVARGVVDPRIYFDAVARSWPLETHPALFANVADDSLVMLSRFIPDEVRPAMRADLAQTAATVVEKEPAGSPRATIAARVIARTSTDESLLRSWLTAGPPWLRDDTDFHWMVVGNLAALGVLNESELAAAEAADPTVSGHLAGLLARASVPTPEAKAWAFEQLTSPTAGHSNHALIELARGLWRSPSRPLVRPFVGPFLDAIPQMTGWVGDDALTKVVRFGFPFVVEAQTIELVDAALARDDLTAGVRRAFVEWSWPVREALASRRRWFGAG